MTAIATTATLIMLRSASGRNPPEIKSINKFHNDQAINPKAARKSRQAVIIKLMDMSFSNIAFNFRLLFVGVKAILGLHLIQAEMDIMLTAVTHDQKQRIQDLR